jgi:thiol-disulfide isomerase/thioredoxin
VYCSNAKLIKMTFAELSDGDELLEFINNNPVAIVCFSATWCGPCKRSKPELEELAKESPVPIGYCYESDFDLDEFGNVFLTSPVNAFPTYVCFKDAAEVGRIDGVRLPELKEMISKYSSSS